MAKAAEHFAFGKNWASYVSLPRTLSLAMRLIGGFPPRAVCGRVVL